MKFINVNKCFAGSDHKRSDFGRGEEGDVLFDIRH